MERNAKLVAKKTQPLQPKGIVNNVGVTCRYIDVPQRLNNGRVLGKQRIVMITWQLLNNGRVLNK
jgi:hypothetical protein